MQSLIYISPRYPSTSLVFEQNEILGLRANGIRLKVLVCRPPGKPQGPAHGFAEPIKAFVSYPRLRSAPLGLVSAIRQNPVGVARCIMAQAKALKNPLAAPKVMIAFLLALGWYKEVKETQADWIHADFGQHTASVALFLSRLLGLPFSFKVHAFDIYDRSWLRRDPLRYDKARAAARILSVHEYGRTLLEGRFPEAKDKIAVNYVSIRPDDFGVLPYPPRDCARFVALGRLAEKKGFDVLVKATSILKQRGVSVRVDIYGSGPEEQRLRAMCQAYGLNGIVRLNGAYRNDDVPEILADALALVVPSVRSRSGDMDGIPTVIYEAMAVGRPVVASRLSGIPEVIHDGENGLLFAPGNAEELAIKMEWLLNRGHEAREMGLRGRKLVEERHHYVLAAAEMLRLLRNPGVGSVRERRGFVAALDD